MVGWFSLPSTIDMDFMKEKGYEAWQGTTVIKLECGHQDAIALNSGSTSPTSNWVKY